MTGCHDDDMMTWHDDKMMPWWEDNKMTRRQGEMITSWQDNKRARWQDKENNSSYSYFLTDMNELTPHVCAFEVGARGFNITKDNNNTTQILKKKKHQIQTISPKHLCAGSECQLLPVHLQEGSCMEWPTTPLCTVHHPVIRTFSTVVRCSAKRGLLGSEPAPFYCDNNIV